METTIESNCIQIRYDGLDAENHQIDLYNFGKSIQGIAKILATLATFSLTGKYEADKRNLSCKVLIQEPKANCFSILATIQAIDPSTVISTLDKSSTLSGIAGGSVVSLLSYLFSSLSGKKVKDMELNSNAVVQLKMLEVFEKMVVGLLPAARDVVQPIGVTCDTIKFNTKESSQSTILDSSDKVAILDNNFHVTESEFYTVIISQLDMKTHKCKVSLLEDLHRRFSAEICDPSVELPNNVYVTAMAARKSIKVKAKKKVFATKTEFVISDVVEN